MGMVMIEVENGVEEWEGRRRKPWPVGIISIESKFILLGDSCRKLAYLRFVPKVGLFKNATHSFSASQHQKFSRTDCYLVI